MYVILTLLFAERMVSLSKQNKPLLYRIIYKIVSLVYPKIEIIGKENIPAEACIIVGNHCQMHGPICVELNFPGNRYTWCVGQLMNKKEAQAFAFMDFWSHKPKYSRWFFKILSHVAAPLIALVLSSAQTIPVYRDNRAVATFKITAKCLAEGATIFIFPEHAVPHNNVISDFQDRFIDVAKLHHKRTGHEICFVPMYLSPELHKLCIGKPTRFNSAAPLDEERQRIRHYLMDEASRMGLSLPPHTVIPFRPGSKKDYPKNTPTPDDREHLGI